VSTVRAETIDALDFFLSCEDYWTRKHQITRKYLSSNEKAAPIIRITTAEVVFEQQRKTHFWVGSKL